MYYILYYNIIYYNRLYYNNVIQYNIIYGEQGLHEALTHRVALAKVLAKDQSAI